MTRPTRARRFIRRRTFRTLGNQLQLAGLGFGVATGVAWPATGELEPFLAGGALVFTCLGLGLERVEVPVSLSAWLRAWWSGVDEDLVDSKEDTLDALSEGQKAVMNAQRKRLQELHDELLAWERTTIDWSALQKDALRSLRGAVTALMPPVAPPPSSDGYSPGWLTADMVMKVRRAVRKSACLPSSELLERVYHELHFVHGGRQTGSASWAYELTIGHLDRVYSLVTHERRQATHERRQATEREAQQQATRDRLVALLDRATSTTHKGFQTLQASVGHLIDRNLQLEEDKRRLEERAFDKPLGDPGLRRLTVSDRFTLAGLLPGSFFVDVTLVRTASIQGVYLILLEKNVEQIDDLPVVACITSAEVVNGPEPLELIEGVSSPLPVDRCTTHPEHVPLHLKSPLLPAGTRLRLTFEHQGLRHAGVALTVTPVVLLHEPPGDALVEDLLEVHQLPVFFDVKALVEGEQQADLEEGGLDGYSRESAKGFAEALDRARERGMPEEVLARFPLELSRPVDNEGLALPSVWAWSLIPMTKRMLGARIQIVVRSETRRVGDITYADPCDNLITAICLPDIAADVQWVLCSQWASVDLLDDPVARSAFQRVTPSVTRLLLRGPTLWRPLSNVSGLEALGETVDWTTFHPGKRTRPTENGTLVVVERADKPFHARAWPFPFVPTLYSRIPGYDAIGWFPKPVVKGEPLLATALVVCAGTAADGAPCLAEPALLVEGRPYCKEHGLELIAQHKRDGKALHVELLPPSLPPNPLDTALLTAMLEEFAVEELSVDGEPLLGSDQHHPDITYQVVHCAGHDKSCERAPVVLEGDVPWCEACLPAGDPLVEELPLRRGLTWTTGRSRPLVEGDALLEQLGPCAACGAEPVGEAVSDTGGRRTEPRCEACMPMPSEPMPSELRELLKGLGPCAVCGAKASGETLRTDTGEPEPRCGAHFPGQFAYALSAFEEE